MITAVKALLTIVNGATLPEDSVHEVVSQPVEARTSVHSGPAALAREGSVSPPSIWRQYGRIARWYL